MPTQPAGLALPAQPDSLGALRAMQAILVAECLVGGVTPFAALTSPDATRFGAASAVFIGRPKDFKDAYLPQCCVWVPENSEVVTLDGYAGRATAEFEAQVQVFVDLRTDWYAGEQRILAIRDALWSALLRHERLGGGVPTVIASEAREGRGLCYEPVGGMEYRCYDARWWVRQQWSVSGGRVV